jgi:hypothetical protein
LLLWCGCGLIDCGLIDCGLIEKILEKGQMPGIFEMPGIFAVGDRGNCK